MKWFLGTYSSRSHRRHKLFDHLFSGRDKSLSVDAANRGRAAIQESTTHPSPANSPLKTAGTPQIAHQRRKKR